MRWMWRSRWRTRPPWCWDALIVPDGEELRQQRWRADGHARNLSSDQYRHCKTIMLIGDSRQLLQATGIGDAVADDGDIGLLLVKEATPEAIQKFADALSKHRHFVRETDPPRI